MRKSFVVVGAIGFGVLVLVGGILVYEVRGSMECQECLSRAQFARWSAGMFPQHEHVLTSDQLEVEKTHIASDLLSPTHRHLWRLRQASPYYFWGTKWGGCVTYGSRWNSFARRYEEDVGFRGFLRRQVADGHLSSEDLLHYLLTPDWGPSSQPPSTIETAIRDRRKWIEAYDVARGRSGG